MPSQTSVFIERIAHNAAILHPHPQENAAAVCDLLASMEWPVSLIGPEKPVRGGVLLFEKAAFDDSIMGVVADDLNNEVDAGVAAYAYQLSEAVDEEGEPTLLFQRVGMKIPEEGNRVILTHTYLFDDTAITWLLGASEDLFQACVAIEHSGAYVRVLPVHADPNRREHQAGRGVDSVQIRHLSPILDSEEVGEVARDVVDVLTLAGFSGPIILTDHREGGAPDSSRLKAGY